jgi:AraC family ethanolamine operon transcriptional activator
VPAADFDQLAARVAGWRTRFTQLAPGGGHGAVLETVLPSVRLVHLAVDTTVALEALPLSSSGDEYLHIGAISAGTDQLLWQGATVRPHMLLLEQGEALSRFALPAGCELLVARLDRGRIESLCDALHGEERVRASSETQLRPQSAAALAELRAQLHALVRADAADGDAQLGRAVDELYERVARMLSTAIVPVGPSPERRRRALRRAEEFVHVHASERLSLSEVCVGAECSERTLRTAFHECYGMSPMAFLKKVRLQGLRRDLRDAAPRADTILRLAARWGFWHMGHLGRDYKWLFGETPSETLGGMRAGVEPSDRSRR